MSNERLILDFVSTKGFHIDNLEPNPDHVHSWALLYEDAIDLCQLCRHQLIPILGGDAISKKQGKYCFTYESWYTQTMKGECFSSYLVRTVNTAISFLERHYMADSSLLYSFTVDPDASYYEKDQ